MDQFLDWLLQGAAGPALVGLPVTWAASDLAGAAGRWFRRLRRADRLSRLVQVAGSSIALTSAEFLAVRKLLEDPKTWFCLIGKGTVDDLADRIADCLLLRDNWTAQDKHSAALVIARGVLEFGIADLEPRWFQQILMNRVQRMQEDQATALDRVMLAIHADVAALFCCRDAILAGQFTRVSAQLGEVLKHLPPGPADRGQLALYLAALIRWLDTDPWLQDDRSGGSPLAQAAVERRLRIANPIVQGSRDLDADVLAKRCARLVVLGGPGSGKTWFAKRSARLCAEASLTALATGALPSEVELPIYATCARLAAAPPGEEIRRVVISTALGQLPDLGGSSVSDAVRALLEERDAPTLLVIDSLDEARGADYRVRQADTLPPGWRIVLTTRPGSWQGQLATGDGDEFRRVGYLQPLRYPDDVEAFINSWFSGSPLRAADLAIQIRNRPVLQQDATVPLSLAFYCMIGGNQALPGRRADLYAKVIRRMLAGRWRGTGEPDPDLDSCLDTLRDWAWSAAASNPVSGVGSWEDEFPTHWRKLGQDDRDALDHLASPVGPRDDDTWTTRRRFIHRTVREHLVADHIASRMPAEQAAQELLNHLWYDPDWEYAAAAALAMHPQRDQVLRTLLCQLTGSDQPPTDLKNLDGCWEFRRFLSRAADESSENAWPQWAAEMISRARQELALSGSGTCAMSPAVTGHHPTR